MIEVFDGTINKLVISDPKEGKTYYLDLTDHSVSKRLPDIDLVRMKADPERYQRQLVDEIRFKLANNIVDLLKIEWYDDPQYRQRVFTARVLIPDPNIYKREVEDLRQHNRQLVHHNNLMKTELEDLQSKLDYITLTPDFGVVWVIFKQAFSYKLESLLRKVRTWKK